MGNQLNDKELFKKIGAGDIKSFEILFHGYYSNLCVFAGSIIHDDVSAEEIVQDFFVKLWEKREAINIESSVKNYLYRSVKNLCLNLIEHNKVKQKHVNEIYTEAKNSSISDNNFIEVDLALKIEESIDSLPEKRKIIFKLSREEGLKYREIAEKLNISIKTVEAQMGLAFKDLRKKLKRYNSSFILYLFAYKF